MKKLYTFALAVITSFTGLFASTGEDTTSFTFSDSALLETLKAMDSASRLKYQTGTIQLQDLAKVNVPKGFKYLDAQQTEFVLTKLWGNPPGSDYLGMLVPENADLNDSASWVFVIQFDPIGYVKDDDAEDIDYDELLTTLKKESEEDNKQRKAMGYYGMELVGWASAPFYDKDKKILHWAKELKVDDVATNTLNYNIRILGRKGVLVLNAIAGMPQLEDVKKNIDPITASVEFEQGQQYSDFNPDVDEVAAWTIGGLVAGKILAKAGLFAVFAKFGKFIILGLVAIGGVVLRFFRGKKNAAPQQNTNT